MGIVINHSENIFLRQMLLKHRVQGVNPFENHHRIMGELQFLGLLGGPADREIEPRKVGAPVLNQGAHTGLELP